MGRIYSVFIISSSSVRPLLFSFPFVTFYHFSPSSSSIGYFGYFLVSSLCVGGFDLFLSAVELSELNDLRWVQSSISF